MKNKYDINEEVTNLVLFISMEDFSLTNTTNIKFSVPVITQEQSSNIEEEKIRINNNNIINKEDFDSNSIITKSNYIICNIPHQIAKECPHDINKIVKKGQKFIGCFLNGDITQPRIIQRSC